MGVSKGYNSVSAHFFPFHALCWRDTWGARKLCREKQMHASACRQAPAFLWQSCALHALFLKSKEESARRMFNWSLWSSGVTLGAPPQWDAQSCSLRDAGLKICLRPVNSTHWVSSSRMCLLFSCLQVAALESQSPTWITALSPLHQKPESWVFDDCCDSRCHRTTYPVISTLITDPLSIELPVEQFKL